MLILSNEAHLSSLIEANRMLSDECIQFNCLNPNYALEIDYMKLLLHIYFGTYFSDLDIVKLCVQNKNFEPHR